MKGVAAVEAKDLTGIKDMRSLELEIEFFVASARSRDKALIKLVHGEGRRAQVARKTVRRMKSSHRAVCFLLGEELGKDSATERYLAERFPELSGEAPSESVTYLCLAPRAVR